MTHNLWMDGVAATEHNPPDVLALVDPLRSYVGAHARDRDDVEDIVQETLARVLDARPELDGGATLGYAIVVARNLMANRARDADRARRHIPRLVERGEPLRPDEVVVAAEERDALRRALATLPEPQREPLLAHVLDDEPVADLAGRRGDSPGSVAAQLSRTRARLRLDFVLALRRAELPTDRCRPVLLALAAGDTRRQRALRAGHHLLHCPTCADLSDPLLRRERALAGAAPWLAIGPLAERLAGAVRRHPWQSTAAGTAAAGAAIAGAVLLWPSDPPEPTPAPPAAAAAAPAPTPPADLRRSDDSQPLLPPPANLAAQAGAPVTAESVPVLEVSANEGFWVGDAARGRVWVQLATGVESPQQVQPGQQVSFSGVVEAHDAAFPAQVGVDDAEGAALLIQQGAHVTADPATVVVAG
jgi:RNA polymerase sigma factor (sigma-70 family)